MPRQESEFPTELELEILKVLWEESPLPVRDVRDRLETEAGRTLAHSTVITMLNIMHRKGYLRRRKQGKSFLFRPKVDRQQVAGLMMGDMVQRLFDGSASAMMLNLLESAEIDADELSEIHQLIAQITREQNS